MKKTILKALLITGLVAGLGTAIAFTSVSAAEIGADAALADESLTVDEMLVYAMQDETLAKAEYEAIIAQYGEVGPFSRILAAENTHIALLLPLFEAYGITVPADESAAEVVVPATLAEAYAAGIAAEEKNIAMYNAFLGQEDLPEDVASVFQSLRNASVRHLNAFTRQQNVNAFGTKMQGWMNQWKKNLSGSNGTCTGDASQSRLGSGR